MVHGDLDWRTKPWASLHGVNVKILIDQLSQINIVYWFNGFIMVMVQGIMS